MTLTYEQKRNNIGEDFIRMVRKDFPMEHFGVADKFLLTLVALDVYEEFEKNGCEQNIRHERIFAFIPCEMERKYGVRCNPFYKEMLE
jgi:hypothetical protein